MISPDQTVYYNWCDTIWSKLTGKIRTTPKTLAAATSSQTIVSHMNAVREQQHANARIISNKKNLTNSVAKVPREVSPCEFDWFIYSGTC